jgi:Obg family GTPase CgtA-like protein
LALDASVELIQPAEYIEIQYVIEKFARRTNFDEFQNVNRLRDIMKKMDIYHQLVRDGAEGNSVVHIGESEFTLLEQ